ncbi:MAG: ATP-dependent 6-phosphofructokinase [Deltaproteobacteria bacterium]|nr:ATP-dependent 6-phosphofructokinase [Deltaproteobacteria bacterium]
MKIAINTGGGDAPGLNAVICAVVQGADRLGWEVHGIRDGYEGIYRAADYPDGGVVRLTPAMVERIAHLGGTILGTTNRGNPFARPTPQPDGTRRETDRSDELLAGLSAHGFDALVAVGGDGSLGIAHRLAAKGLRVVGVPKTIDNDLDATALTFGFQTAVAFATECVDRLHSTAQAHGRVMVVEVMGRYAGWIALNTGVAGGADAILVPEIPYDLGVVAEHLKERVARRGYALVVVAEGAAPKGGAVSVKARELGRAEQLGGAGERIAAELGGLTGRETRAVVLGHLLRGGSPVAVDRLLGLNFGAAAVRALAEGKRDVMVALDPPRVSYVPLADAVARTRLVPLDADSVLTARTLGIAFGD